MMTSSAELSGNFGCGSIGMPRPLSVTDTEAVRVERDVDAAGVAGHRLVHGVVDHFGEEVMQARLVGAADIHAGPPAHRLQPFQDLDRGRRIAGLVGRAVARDRGRPAPSLADAVGRPQVVVHRQGEEVVGSGESGGGPVRHRRVLHGIRGGEQTMYITTKPLTTRLMERHGGEGRQRRSGPAGVNTKAFRRRVFRGTGAGFSTRTAVLRFPLRPVPPGSALPTVP